MALTEQFILLQAPNPAAAENGRKLAKGGKFPPAAKVRTAPSTGRSAPEAEKIPTTPPSTGRFPTPPCAGAAAPAGSFPASMPWG